MALVPGFPISAGPKRVSVITKAGPSSYTVITTGAPPTGGQDVTAAEFGLKYIESLHASGSQDGLCTAVCIPTTSGTGPPTWKLQWVLSISGQETSGDLSAKYLRLTAIGF